MSIKDAAMDVREILFSTNISTLGKRWKVRELRGLLNYDVLRLAGMLYVISDQDQREQITKTADELFELDNSRPVIEQLIKGLRPANLLEDIYGHIPYLIGLYYEFDIEYGLHSLSYAFLEVEQAMILGMTTEDDTLTVNDKAVLFKAYMDIWTNRLVASGISTDVSLHCNIPSYEKLTELYAERVTPFTEIPSCPEAKAVYDALKRILQKDELTKLVEKSKGLPISETYPREEYESKAGEISAIIDGIEDAGTGSVSDITDMFRSLAGQMKDLSKGSTIGKEPEPPAIDKKKTVSSSSEVEERLRLNRLKKKLEEVTDYAAENDYTRSMEALSEAVDLGYDRDYAIIGALYLSGKSGVPKDTEKGFYWLHRFYDDYHSGRLNLGGDISGVIQTCSNLGAGYMMQYAGLDLPDEEKQQWLDTHVLKYFREAAELTAEYPPEEENESSARLLFPIGCSFYYGKLPVQGVEPIEIEVNYELAYKALTGAKQYGNNEADLVLGEMYEKGQYVRQDVPKAERMFIELALEQNENAIEWCQEHFIDQLPWDKRDNWADVTLEEISTGHPGHIAHLIGKTGITTLEDFRHMDMKEFMSKASSAPACRRLLTDVREYVTEIQK